MKAELPRNLFRTSRPAPLAGPALAWKFFFRDFRREDLTICLLSLAILSGVIIALHAIGAKGPDSGWLAVNILVYFNVLIYAVLIDAVMRILKARPEKPLHFAFAYIFSRANLQKIACAIPVIIAIGAFMPGFSSIKSSIELFSSFTWDTPFIELDRSLHGQDPWRLLQPFLGYPAITQLLSSAYHLWFMLIYFGPIYFAVYSTDRMLRLQFFLAYFLTWTICGMVLAIAFASVGPCFIGPLLGNGYFADQMSYLGDVHRAFPLFTVEIQEQLLAWYKSGDHGLGRGITAMPSMHVALAFLYVLAMRRISKPLGWLFGAFCLLIMLGSVHLGYHYAIDGYVAIAVTAAIWAAAGALARRLRTIPAPMALLDRSNRNTKLAPTSTI